MADNMNETHAIICQLQVRQAMPLEFLTVMEFKLFKNRVNRMEETSTYLSAICSCLSSMASLLSDFHIASVSADISSVSRKATALKRKISINIRITVNKILSALGKLLRQFKCVIQLEKIVSMSYVISIH